MMYRRLAVIVLILLCASVASAAHAGSNHGFLPPGQAFQHQVKTAPDGTVTLHWTIAPGYYLYRQRFEIKGSPAPVKSVRIPPGTPNHDEYFGDQHVFTHGVTITVAPGQARHLDLTWQGCAKAGLCYPPQHATIDLAALGSAQSTDKNGPANPTAASTPSGNGSLSRSQTLAARLASSTIGWVIAAFFGMGLLLTFTPCVLPMIPILSSLIVGSGARRLRGFVLSLAFVIPMALTYSGLGVAAALAGANLQVVLETPPVLTAFALVFVVLALSMFGVFELQLPGPLRERLNRASQRQRGGHLAGAAAMGVVSALLVSPCMTAPLAGALLYIAQSGNAALGGLALLSLGLGMGAPIIVVGTVGAQLLPRPGPWMTAVKVIFGFVLLATALWFFERFLAGPIMLGLWGAWLLSVALTFWQTSARIKEKTAVATIARVVGLLLGLWGILMVIGAAGGADSPLRPLSFLHTGQTTTAARTEQSGFMARFKPVANTAALERDIAAAKSRGQWTLVDFYADWCVSCKVIDHTVFGDPQVQRALASVQLLRPDVTHDDKATRALMHRLGVIGPPTILFIGPDGRERRGSRIVGELNARAFLKHWAQARGQSGDSENAAGAS